MPIIPLSKAIIPIPLHTVGMIRNHACTAVSDVLTKVSKNILYVLSPKLFNERGYHGHEILHHAWEDKLPMTCA